MSRFNDIVIALRNAVISIVPQSMSDYGFTTQREGVIEAPYKWMLNPDRRTRDFDIAVGSFPVRDGGCGLQMLIHVLISYRLDEAHDLVDLLIAEDMISVINSIERDPSVWGGADSLHSPEPPTVEEISYEESGNPAHYLVTIPFSVDFLEP